MTDTGDGPISTCTFRQPFDGKRSHGYLQQNTICCAETRLVQWVETKRSGKKSTLIFSRHHLWPYLLQTFTRSSIVWPWHHAAISSLWCVLHNTADIHSCCFPATSLWCVLHNTADIHSCMFGDELCPTPLCREAWPKHGEAWGGGIARWLEPRTRDWKVVGLNPCRSGGRIFFSRVSFLCWLLFWHRSTPVLLQ